MRPTSMVRRPRPGRLAIGALMISIPATAAGLGASQALAATASAAATVPAQVHASRVAFEHPVVVTGAVPAADAGNKLALEFLPAGGSSWAILKTASAGPDGHYRLSASLRKTGLVRVSDLSTPAAPVASAAGVTSSSGQRVTVTAKLHVHPQALGSVGGQPVTVSGALLPGIRGRIVRLQGRGHGGGWRTLATTATRQGGRFSLRFRPSAGAESLRVRFAGDPQNAWTSAPAGTATSYQSAEASWYDDGGSTACGFHAHFGVANKDLPCGTQVQFSYHGRTVTATVDDRGPYVGGRDWDLDQNTAGALGFDGVDTVLFSY